MNPDEARFANRTRFAELISRPEPGVDLARGALLIAAAGRPDLDPQPTLAALDQLADRVRQGLLPGESAEVVLERLHDVLYREVGLRPPRGASASHANNSLLDVVVTRHVGLPISLAIVELEVAHRIGLELHGVALPGHFVVGGPNGILLDPAGGGRRLNLDDCQALIRRALGEAILLNAGMLRPARPRAILARVLRNLRIARLVARDWPAAVAAIELLEVLEPDAPDHGRDRGLLLGRMGRFSQAVALLGAYVESNPEAGDAGDVRQALGIFAARRN